MDDDETGEKEGGARLRRGAPTRDRGVSFALAWRSRYFQGELLHGGESKTHVDVAVAEFLAGNNSYNMPLVSFVAVPEKMYFQSPDDRFASHFLSLFPLSRL
jgi:hypothetical protein